METMLEQFFSMGADQARSKIDAMCQVFFNKFEPMPLLRRVKGKEEEEGIVKTNRSKTKPVSS